MTTITLTDSYKDLDGSAAQGRVRLAPWEALVSAAMDQTVTIQPVTIQLAADGSFSLPMPLLPDVAKVFVEVQVLLQFCRPDVFTVDIPLDGTNPVVLSDLPRVEYEPPGPGEAPVVLWSEVGVSVAPLIDGKVPIGFLPTAAGGEPAAQGTVVDPDTHWVLQHNLGWYPAAVWCQDTQGTQLLSGAVQWPDANTVTVDWSQLEAGTWKVS